MKVEQLAANVHRNHLQIQSQLNNINQLQKDIQEYRLEYLKSQWLARNRRFIVEKLNQNIDDYIESVKSLSKDKNFEFIKTSSTLGSSGESSLTELFQYLRNNPKLIAYLLFFIETEKSSFLGLFTKIIVSSIYSNCIYEPDRYGIVHILNELLDIYINFYSSNFRKHIYHKNSAFIVLFESFCSVLPEVKSFFNLTLRQAVMQVLTEDTFYLDINPNNAYMRFNADERLKHFGAEGSDEYNFKMETYKNWTIQRLKTFVDLFISHLKCNIFAFPKSLATIFVRLFSKMIVTMEFNEVRAIFFDLLFSFLICPVIQNPDLFGLVHLYIDNVAKYNLQQCALIIRHLALSKSDTEHEMICNLFEKDSLAFVIDHILGIFNNQEQAQQSPTFDTRYEKSQNNIPCFLMSDFELKLFLEYLRFFMERNLDCSEELKRLYFKIPKQCFRYEIEKRPIKQLKKNPISGLKLPGALRGQRSQDALDDAKRDEFDFNVAFQETNFANVLEHYKPLIFVRKVFQFYLYDNQEFEILTSKSFFKQFKSLVSQFDSIDRVFEFLKEKFHLENKKNEKKFVHTFQSPERMLLVDLDTQLNVDLNGPFGTKSFIPEIPSQNHNEKLIDLSPVEDTDFFLAERTTIETKKNLLILSSSLSSNSSSSSASRSSSSTAGRLNSLLNMKNIKDKVKNTIKDSASNTKSMPSVGFLESVTFRANSDTLIHPDLKINPEIVKDKTNEILSKYRGSNNKVDVQEKLLDLDDFFSNSSTEKLEKLSENDCKRKLFKLFSMVNLSAIIDGFEFLILEDKNHFIMFLKVLLSEAQNSKSLTEIVLITDIINSLKEMSSDDFHFSLQSINDDLKLNTFYSVYLIICIEYLLEYQTKISKNKQRYASIQQETDYKVVAIFTGKIFSNHENDFKNEEAKINDLSIPLDEKISGIKSLVQKMIFSINSDHLTKQQFTMTRTLMERHLISAFYLQLFFPNGDIDRMRDQIMHEQIEKLSMSTNPSSKMFKIPQIFQGSSPWPSAQRELQLMSIYKSPHEKMECVERSCKHIITLLNAADSYVPAADDLLPVLTFVVVKANPMSLLSTIQYVDAYISEGISEDPHQGELRYYWTQFCSVVEYIKKTIHEQML